MKDFWKHRRDTILMLLLLTLHLALTAGFLRHNFLTVDEGVHWIGGFEILQNKNHNINPESGVLPQVLSALAVSGELRMPPPQEMEKSHTLPYDYAGQQIDRMGDRLSSLAFRSRLMMTLLSLLCGYMLFRITRELCGKTPALLTLGLYVFFPLYLGHGGLMTADLAASVFFLTSAWFFWRLIQRFTIPGLILTAFSCAALALSKMSAPVIAPFFLLLIVLRLIGGKPAKWRFFSGPWNRLEGRWKMLAASMTCWFLIGGFTLLAVWAAYGFRAEFPTLPESALRVRRIEASMNTAGAAAELIKFLGRNRILPEPYVYGFLHTYYYSQRRWSYLNGKVSMTGFPLFFPAAFLYKTPPPIILTFLLAAAAVFALRKTPAGRRRLYQFLPLGLFAAIFTGFALASRLNIGYRHLMPAITLFFPFCGLAFLWLQRQKKRRLRIAPLLLVLWGAGESLTVYPHTLAYFSPLFGGPKRAARHLVDSSLDWGQDITNIKSVLQARRIPCDGSVPLYLGCLTGLPLKHAGFPFNELEFSKPYPLSALLFDYKPGIYLMSATILRGFNAYSPMILLDEPVRLQFCKDLFTDLLHGKPRPPESLTEKQILNSVREYQGLRMELIRRTLVRRKPDFHVNYSITGYRLTEEDLQFILKDLR